MSELPLTRCPHPRRCTQLGAGPYAMTMLGDLGAEIIKVEDPTTGGDEARTVPPYADRRRQPLLPVVQPQHQVADAEPAHAARARTSSIVSCEVADAVYSNPRGDLPAKLGLDYASLKDVNPRIVCCALSGFGKTGPRATDPGYDFLIQALAGFMSVTGEPDGAPTRCGVSIVDFSGGLMSAVGLLIGLLRARETGDRLRRRRQPARHRRLDAQLPGGVESQPAATASTGWPDGAHQTLVPSQTFPTRTATWSSCA